MAEKTPVFAQKDPAEVLPLSFDFSRWTTTIDSATWSVTLLSGTDPAVGSMLVGLPTNSTGITTHLVSGGLSGCEYLVRADIISGDAHYALAAKLPVLTLGSSV